MSEASTELDRNERATGHKLRKARERGAVARSAEVVFLGVLLAASACVHGLGDRLLRGLGTALARGLGAAGRTEIGSAAALHELGRGLQAGAALATPLLFAVWVAAVGAALVQVRGIFSSHPLRPDFSRLSPAQGLARMLSLRSLHEAPRAVLKLAAVAVAVALWGRERLGELRHAALLPAPALARQGVATVGSLLTTLVAVLALVALLDYAAQRWQFMRQMRMSRREIRDEHKEREGDPHIRQRLRELRVEWLRRVRSLARVRSADVVLVNPTHVAVALEYRHGEMPAPAITVRGAGELARRIRQEARRRGVPVVEHAPLARALFATDDRERYVPEACFAEVARILRWVYAARRPGAAGRSA